MTSATSHCIAFAFVTIHLKILTSDRQLGAVHFLRNTNLASRKIPPPHPCNHAILYTKFKVFCHDELKQRTTIAILVGALCLSVAHLLHYAFQHFLASLSLFLGKLNWFHPPARVRIHLLLCQKPLYFSENFQDLDGLISFGRKN